ncbi:MAG TPA: prepilin peptidase [Candidatus Saccharimonadales bacterium]|jgi:prepilin signal peptidase PulO-like enzyme (type II secretory pathway)
MIVLLLAILGLVFGSFVNALVWRLHEQEKIADGRVLKSKRARLRELSMWRGRSMCPHCHHQLAAKDLVPVVSWLWLHGKCRYCHHKIEDSPAIELVTALLFAISYLFWPAGLHGLGLMQFYFFLAFLVGFVALAVYDLRWFLLPDRIVFPLIGLAVVELLATLIFFHGGWAALGLAVWGVAIASGLFLVLYQVSRGEWIGGGDVKLGIVLGILIGGPIRSLLLLFIASLLGTLVSLPLLITAKANKKTLIPFGPFLLTAAVIIELFGSHFVDWLNHFPG